MRPRIPAGIARFPLTRDQAAMVDAANEAIEERIDEWYDAQGGRGFPEAVGCPLFTYVGLTPDEYAHWVEDSRRVPGRLWRPVTTNAAETPRTNSPTSDRSE